MQHEVQEYGTVPEHSGRMVTQYDQNGITVITQIKQCWFTTNFILIKQ